MMHAVVHFVSVLTSSGPRSVALWCATAAALLFFWWVGHDSDDAGT